MTEFNETTSVKINKEKKNLAKAKGLKLQDLLDDALNRELNLDTIPKTQKSIEDISDEIEKLKISRDKAEADCAKKINILIKGLNEFKKEETLAYNKKIKFLEAKLEYLKKGD